mgnify:CR=1 FL=1
MTDYAGRHESIVAEVWFHCYRYYTANKIGRCDTHARAYAETRQELKQL